MVLGQIGSASLFLALGLSIYGIGMGILGLVQRDRRMVSSARVATVMVFMALTVAMAILEFALITNDFSVEYVAQTSSLGSPLWVKVVTLWAALDGSILLWSWLLSGYTAALALFAPNTALRPWGLIVMLSIQLFFLGVLGSITNPFTLVSNPPFDGPGPNALLQNHWMMAVHPVLMYMGIVGLTVPFAYAIAALIIKRPGSEWMRETRFWTLIGWGFLSVAIIAGGWWSYEVLGWGGYWAWDPVENLIFLPWLTATAFLHSVQVQERRRMLKIWNIFLIVLTFSLSILSTFLIRSGVLSSVHSFGDGPVGPVFLAFFIVVVVSAFGLVALRWDQLQDQAELDSPLSREGGFLLNNVLLTAMTFAVLLGTLFPLIVEALTGDKVTVGAPFFNLVSIPLWLLLFALMGIGPLLPWRKAKGQRLLYNSLWLGLVGLISGLIAFGLGIKKVYPLLTIILSGYNLASLALLFFGAVIARRRATGRRFDLISLDYVRENKRRFGSMIVHFAVIIIALGVAGSGGYRVDTQLRIAYGETISFEGYELQAIRSYTENLAHRSSLGAEISVSKNGRILKTLRPRVNRFANSQQNVTTPGVVYLPFEDIYLNIASQDEQGQFVVVRAVRSPLITWIWFGGLIMLLGTFYTLLPGLRKSQSKLTNLAPT